MASSRGRKRLHENGNSWQPNYFCSLLSVRSPHKGSNRFWLWTTGCASVRELFVDECVRPVHALPSCSLLFVSWFFNDRKEDFWFLFCSLAIFCKIHCTNRTLCLVKWHRLWFCIGTGRFWMGSVSVWIESRHRSLASAYLPQFPLSVWWFCNCYTGWLVVYR
jgi:hypothetical protein